MASTAQRNTGSPTRRSQEERSRTTRAALIRAAVECLARSGYAATTLTDVAAAAGLTKGAMQHHFQDKQDLMLSVEEHVVRGQIERLRGVSEIEGSLEERVDAVIDRQWEWSSTPGVRAAFEIALATRARDEYAAQAKRLDRELVAALEDEYCRLFSDAPAGAQRVRRARRHARDVFNGILWQIMVDPDPGDIQGDLELLKETVLHLLTTRGPERSPRH